MSENTTREPGSPAPEGASTPERPRRGRRLPPPAFPPGERGPRTDAPREAHPGELADAMISPTVVHLAEDPPVMEVVEMVGRLAGALRQRGQAALQVTPEMSPFEATLRAYCVGYIAGRRGEEEHI